MIDRPEFPGEQKKRLDYPLPPVGAICEHRWFDGTTHRFRVERHYEEKHDVRDPTTDRLHKWREHVVTKGVYTCDCHEGSSLYLWEDRWNECAIIDTNHTPES